MKKSIKRDIKTTFIVGVLEIESVVSFNWLFHDIFPWNSQTVVIIDINLIDEILGYIITPYAKLL